MLECVINISEGRRTDVVSAIAGAGGSAVLDVHADPHHHRAVITLAGPHVADAARAVTTEAVRRIDIRHHAGAHPRLGAVDVVPFVPLPPAPAPAHAPELEAAIAARDTFAGWVAGTLGVPCFLYGPDRALPDVRRRAFASLFPDHGPQVAHPTAGAVCAGARPVLVAYNVWLAEETGAGVARSVAAHLRAKFSPPGRPPLVRALGLEVGDHVQVSMNLLDPLRFGPGQAYDEVASHASVARAEVVGLVPKAVLDAVPAGRWAELDLDPSRTIEARLEEAGRRW